MTNRTEHADAMRERGTIVSWSGTAMGKIEAESGERLPSFYWTVLGGVGNSPGVPVPSSAMRRC